MGFEASRAALRYGYNTVKEWLEGPGAVAAARFASHPPATKTVRPG
jgi:hypothetical protein